MNRFLELVGLKNTGIKNCVAATALMIGISTSASATYTYGDVIADAGTYAPLSLGQNITLNACGSTFAGYSLCDLLGTNKFGIEWFILKHNDQYNYNDWLAQYTYHQAASDANLQKTIATGAGASVINSVGTYLIGLHVISYGDTIPLPMSGYAQGGDSDWNWSGMFTVSEASVTPPSSVPEPLGILLILPSLAYIARRERRRHVLVQN